MQKAHRPAPARPPPKQAQQAHSDQAAGDVVVSTTQTKPPQSLLRIASENASSSSLAATQPDALSAAPLAKRKPPTKQTLLKQQFGKSIAQFTRHFRRWDTDGSRCINKVEFRTALQMLKLPHSEDEEACEQLFKAMDFDGSGTITRYECLRYALLDVIQRELDKVYTLCILWDHDSSKTINRDEFCRIVDALKLEVPKLTVMQLFDELDSDKTGELPYEDLTRKLRGAPPGQMARELAADATSSKEVAKARLRRATTAARLVSPTFGLAAAKRSSTRLPIDDGSSDDDDEANPLANALEQLQYLSSNRVAHIALQAEADEYARRAITGHYRISTAAHRSAPTGPRSWPGYQRYGPTARGVRSAEAAATGGRWRPQCHWRYPPPKSTTQSDGSQEWPAKTIYETKVEQSINRYRRIAEPNKPLPEAAIVPPRAELPLDEDAERVRMAERAARLDAEEARAAAIREYELMTKAKAEEESAAAEEAARDAKAREDARDRRRRGEAKLHYTDWLEMSGRAERAYARWRGGCRIDDENSNAHELPEPSGQHLVWRAMDRRSG